MYLITGGAGFIGSHLVQELIRYQQDVRVFDNFSSGKRQNLDGMLDRVELVAEVPLDQLDAIEHAVEVLSLPAREVVEHPDILLVPDQFLDEVGPDEPRAAGDQVHMSSPVCRALAN